MTAVVGSPRFWCPETVNAVVGVCAELLVVNGHRSTFVYALPDGEPLARWATRIPAGAAIARAGDELVVDDALGGRRRYALATGALVGEDPAGAPRAATIELDDDRTRVTIRGGAGDAVSHATPWVQWACVARDGARFAVVTADGLCVRARDGEEIYRDDTFGTPVLSADGRWGLASSLAASRLRVIELATGEPLTDEPPRIAEVFPCTRSLVVIDGVLWALEPAEVIHAFTRLGRTLAVRGDTVIGTTRFPLGATRGHLGAWTLDDPDPRALVAIPARAAANHAIDLRGRYAALTLDNSRGLLLDLLDGIWLADLATATIARIADAPGDAAIAIDAAGERIVACHDDVLRILARDGRELERRAVPLGTCASFAPDDSLHVWPGDPDARDDERWLGWWPGAAAERVRRVGATLERVAADGTVVARHAMPDDVRRVWLGPDTIATSADDGRVVLAPARWT